MLFSPHLPFRRLALSATALITLSAGAAIAAPAPDRVQFDLPKGSLASVLLAFSAQSHKDLAFNPQAVAGLSSPGFHGSGTPAFVLDQLLAGTAFTVDRSRGAWAVVKSGPTNDANLHHASAEADPQVDPVFSGQPAAPAALPTTVDEKPAEIVVTGTHIRGVTAIASPSLEVTKDDLRREGDATVADALARLPQVFNGAATQNSYLTGSDKLGSNLADSQGVDLRGLGASSTLVLMNGRRLAGTGSLGDFTDLSAIPTAAVDHVEVVLDGASAIYGSDAVGGVVNVITKKNFVGAETSVRLSEDAGGVGASGLVSQTFGFGWDGGNLLVALEYQHSDPLASASRRYAADTNLTALGGTNHDVLASSPGNILSINAAGTAYISQYAIPSGNGVGLTPSSFLAGQSNLENGRLGTDLLPEQDRSGVYLDLNQALGPHTSLDLEARYNVRVTQYNEHSEETALLVTPKDPFYVTPNGSSYEEIGYATDVTGPVRQSATSVNWDVSAGLNQDLGRTWRVSAYAGFAEETGRTFISNLWNSAHLSEALGNSPATGGYSPTALGYFNPYGNGSGNSAALLSFIDQGYERATDVSQISSFDLQADGTVFSLPGGPVKAAFGFQYRHERFEGSIFSFTSSAPYVQGGSPDERDVAAGFGEVQIPIIGAANALPGIERLELSVAGRIEHYDDAGTTSNPKVGVVWVPVQDVKVHATYGTSFRAPSLPEDHQPTTYAPATIETSGQTELILEEAGGNPALKPQTATTYTAGVDYSPHWLSGLRLGADWFSIDFKNEISIPGINILEAGLDAPAYASLVTHLNPNNPADLALVTALLAKAPPGTASLYPASAYTAIIDDRYVNSAELSVAGVDFDGGYAFRLGANTFNLFGSATWLYDYSQRVTAQSPDQQLVSTPDYPVDFRGRLTGVWSRGPYSLAGTINYVGSYHDPVADRSISSWTTFDLSATWTPPVDSGPLSGFVVTAAAQNLFDQDPPFYDSPNAIGYDPANANPLGRVVSLQLTKRW